MLGIHRLIFFGKASGRKIFNTNTCYTRPFGIVVSRRILNQSVHSYLSCSGKLGSRNLIDIKTNYHVKCLSCSSRYVNFNNKEKDQSSNNKDKDERSNVSNNQPEKVNIIIYLLKRFRFIAEVFWHGCKNLFKDVRLALRIRRKLGLYHQRDYSKLTREEVRHMHQTKDDVAKTFPVAFLFMIPFIGYTAPILAFFYPKQLLSQQFWHPDQKKEFILEEYEKRSQYYLPLIKEIATTCKEIKSKELYKLCLHVINGNHPTNMELLQFKEIFSKFSEFSLQCVPRYHLVKLCKCWLIPTGWFLPRWYLTNALRKRISRLHEDDMMILQEGISIMSPKSVAKAVHVRGLDESALNLSSEILWLEEWIQISSKVSGDDISFLAHCTAFKGANFEKIAIENGILPKTTE